MRTALLIVALLVACWTVPLWADDGGGDDEFQAPPIEVSLSQQEGA